MNETAMKELRAWLGHDEHCKKELASLLGITPKTLRARFRTGNWRWSEVCMLADLLGVNTEDLR